MQFLIRLRLSQKLLSVKQEICLYFAKLWSEIAYFSLYWKKKKGFVSCLLKACSCDNAIESRAVFIHRSVNQESGMHIEG